MILHLWLLNLGSFITFRPCTACSSSGCLSFRVTGRGGTKYSATHATARPKIKFIVNQSKPILVLVSIKPFMHLPEFQAKLFFLRNWVFQSFPWFKRRGNEKCLTTTDQFQYYRTVLSFVDYPNEWYVNVDHDLAMVVLLYLKKTFNTVNHEIL